MKLIIYSQNIVEMDGVGNSVFYFSKVLEKFFDVEIIAHFTNIQTVKNFKQYIAHHDDENILLYHYSIKDVNLDLLLDLNFKKRILYFHGITPANFFKTGSELFKNCKEGIESIKDLGAFDLYLSNSTATKKQFLHNSNFEINKFLIMPPIDILGMAFLNSAIKSNIKKELSAYYIGSLSAHKRVNDLLKAFENYNSEINLNIYTNYSEEDTKNVIKNYSRILKNSNISFFNRLGDELMHLNTIEKDFFISFSMHEGFCIPAFNSLMKMKPALVYELECFKDYFPFEYNYLSKKDNLDVIKKKYLFNLSKINSFHQHIKDRCLKLSKEGFESIKEIIRK